MEGLGSLADQATRTPAFHPANRNGGNDRETMTSFEDGKRGRRGRVEVLPYVKLASLSYARIRVSTLPLRVFLLHYETRHLPSPDVFLSIRPLSTCSKSNESCIFRMGIASEKHFIQSRQRVLQWERLSHKDSARQVCCRHFSQYSERHAFTPKS